VINIEVTATQVAIPNDVFKYINCYVKITNRGTRTARLGYENDREPFAVTAVSFEDDGRPKFGESLRLHVPQAASPSASAVSTIVRAGSSEMLPFVCRVKNAGVYYVTFRVQVSPEVSEELVTQGVPSRLPTSWTGKTYIVVN